MAADLDGNLIRVFYDFRGETWRDDAQEPSTWFHVICVLMDRFTKPQSALGKDGES